MLVSGTPPSHGAPYTLAHKASNDSLSFRLPSETSLNDWVKTWNDSDVARWLHDNKMGQYAAVFRDNDIRGSVVLDVDQSALKEMNVQSVGDRIKIVVAIKKLRSACIASSANSIANRTSRLSNAPSSSGNTSPPANYVRRTGSVQRSAQRIPPPLHLHDSYSQTSAHQEVLAPNVNQHHATYQYPSSSSSNPATGSSRQHSASSSSSSLLSAPIKSSALHSPSATSPGIHSSSAGQHIRRASSPRQGAAGPPTVPAPKSSLPPHPATIDALQKERARSSSSNTPSHNVPLGQATRSTKYPPHQVQGTLPAVNISKAGQIAQMHRKTGSLSTNPSPMPGALNRPSTANASYHHQPLNLSNHPYATNSSPTLDSFETISAPTLNRPSTANASKSIGLSPISEAPRALKEKEEGFAVGKGGFARPTTPAGTLSATSQGLVASSSASSMEELMRKTVKFGSEEDGITKLVNVENITDSLDVMKRVLKKFGKLSPNAQLARFRDNDSIYSELDGWGIFATTPDGTCRWLNDSDLFNICQSIHRPERQRGLLLRMVDKKRTPARNKLRDFFGEEVVPRPQQQPVINELTSPTSPSYMLDVRVPATAVEPASPTPSSPSSDSGEAHAAVDQGKTQERELQRRPNKMNRASTVSVMSGLLDWQNGGPAARSPSMTAGFLSNRTTRLRSFFGHRPPSELISSHLADYFPSAEKKLLNKTVRNSVRKSMAARPKSAFTPSLPSLANWDANSSRFSISSAGSVSTAGGAEPPPPLPSKDYKDHYAPAPLNQENSRWSRIPASQSGSSLEEEGDSGENFPKDLAENKSDSIDDESLGVRRSKSRASQSSRLSSRLSVHTSRSTGKDSDNASLLTVDEITAEVEHRRMSLASNWPARTASVLVATDETEYTEGDDRSSRSLSSQGFDEEEEEDTSDEEEEEDASSDEGDGAPEKVTSTGTKNQIKWIKGALIGAGSFGQVFLAMNAMNGTLMAVKQVEIPTGDSHNESRKKNMLDALEREIDLLKGLQHPNIVEYLDSSSDGTHLNIFLEYVPGGSVVALLRNYGAFEEPLVRIFVRQVLEGLNYLHEREIVHRDIKGANILVDNKGQVKISDFGISKKVEDNLLSGVKIHRPSLQGSVFWMAPEVVKQTSYTSKADVWSLGCVTIEMLTGDHPYVNLNQMQALFKIGTGAAAPEMPSDISTEAQNFLKKTFQQDYKARPSAADLLKMPFITEPLNMSISQRTPTAQNFSI